MLESGRMAEHAEHGGNPKMFADMVDTQDGLTTWQRFEKIAGKVFSVRKDEIDPNKPVRPRAKQIKRNRTGKPKD